MSKTVKIILIVVLCLAILGGIAGVVAWTQSDKFDQKDLSYVGKYEVGGLDSNGSYMSTNASIYTKKPIECQGLNCNLVFDSTISYQLYFYDQNNEFVHTTGKLTGTFVEEGVPFFAKYVRIVITPNDDDKVTSLEVSKYAKQLNVSVNREQGFKNYTENLFFKEVANSHLANGEITTDVEKYPNTWVSNKVNVSSYKEGFIFKYSGDIGPSWIGVFDLNGKFVGQCPVEKCSTIKFISSEGKKYYFLDFNKLQSSDNSENLTPITDIVGYLQINILSNDIVELYCR